MSHWFDVWQMTKVVYKKLENVGKKKVRASGRLGPVSLEPPIMVCIIEWSRLGIVVWIDVWEMAVRLNLMFMKVMESDFPNVYIVN